MRVQSGLLEDISALEWGIVNAKYSMSVMYTHGVVVESDAKHAFKLCKSAAEQGLAAAQNDLGFMYACGHGVAADSVSAIFWYVKAGV